MIDLHAPILDLGRPAGGANADLWVEASMTRGATTVVCTPTMVGHPEEWLTARDRVVRELDALRVADIRPGALIDLEMLPRLGDDVLRRLSLGGNGRWVLVSLPAVGWPIELGTLIDALDIRGFGVILAEPELNESVQRSAGRLRDPVGRGALVLVSARSLTLGNGRRVRWTAANLLRNGMVHAIGGGGSVDHAPQLLEGVVAAATVLRREPRELSWLVQDGPEQVLAGGPVRAPKITVLRRSRPTGESPPATRA